MAKLDGLETVLDFLKGLQPKITAQTETHDSVKKYIEGAQLHFSVTMENSAMKFEELITQKREAILNLAAKHGACNVRIFGSVARGDAREDSDIDFLIDLGEKLSPWFPVRFIRDLENLLGCKVDVITEKGLKERIRERVIQEAVPL